MPRRSPFITIDWHKSRQFCAQHLQRAGFFYFMKSSQPTMAMAPAAAAVAAPIVEEDDDDAVDMPEHEYLLATANNPVAAAAAAPAAATAATKKKKPKAKKKVDAAAAAAAAAANGEHLPKAPDVPPPLVLKEHLWAQTWNGVPDNEPTEEALPVGIDYMGLPVFDPSDPDLKPFADMFDAQPEPADRVVKYAAIGYVPRAETYLGGKYATAAVGLSPKYSLLCAADMTADDFSLIGHCIQGTPELNKQFDGCIVVWPGKSEEYIATDQGKARAQAYIDFLKKEYPAVKLSPEARQKMLGTFIRPPPKEKDTEAAATAAKPRDPPAVFHPMVPGMLFNPKTNDFHFVSRRSVPSETTVTKKQWRFVSYAVATLSATWASPYARDISLRDAVIAANNKRTLKLHMVVRNKDSDVAVALILKDVPYVPTNIFESMRAAQDEEKKALAEKLLGAMSETDADAESESDQAPAPPVPAPAPAANGVVVGAKPKKAALTAAKELANLHRDQQEQNLALPKPGEKRQAKERANEITTESATLVVEKRVKLDHVSLATLTAFTPSMAAAIAKQAAQDEDDDDEEGGGGEFKDETDDEGEDEEGASEESLEEEEEEEEEEEPTPPPPPPPTPVILAKKAKAPLALPPPPPPAAPVKPKEEKVKAKPMAPVLVPAPAPAPNNDEAEGKQPIDMQTLLQYAAARMHPMHKKPLKMEQNPWRTHPSFKDMSATLKGDERRQAFSDALYMLQALAPQLVAHTEPLGMAPVSDAPDPVPWQEVLRFLELPTELRYLMTGVDHRPLFDLLISKPAEERAELLNEFYKRLTPKKRAAPPPPPPAPSILDMDLD